VLSGLCSHCQTNPGEQAQAARARRRRFAFRVAWAAVGSMLAVGLAAILYCTPVIRGPVEDIGFSPDGWAAGDARMRGRMARDVMASRVLLGKSRDEVRRVLGPPDAVGVAGAYYRYRVDVGYRWVLRPVPYDLVVRFMKVEHWTWAVEVRPAEDAEPHAAADCGLDSE